MANLVRNQHFADFIEMLRDLKEEAVHAACLETTLKNERLTMATLGEVRVYDYIISVYEDFKDQPAEEEAAE